MDIAEKSRFTKPREMWNSKREYNEEEFDNYIKTVAPEHFNCNNFVDKIEDCLTPEMIEINRSILEGHVDGAMISGPVGSGKDFYAKLLVTKAKAVPWVINITAGTDIIDLLDGPLMRAFEIGKFVIITDIEYASQKVEDFIFDLLTTVKYFTYRNKTYLKNRNFAFYVLHNNENRNKILGVRWTNTMPVIGVCLPNESKFVHLADLFNDILSPSFFRLLYKISQHIIERYPNIRYDVGLPSFRHAQRFLNFIFTKFRNFEEFKEYFKIIYIGDFADIIKTNILDKMLEELYNFYDISCHNRLAIEDICNRFDLGPKDCKWQDFLESIRLHDKDIKTEKKEEEKKDMKDNFVIKFYDNLNEETKKMFEGMIKKSQVEMLPRVNQVYSNKKKGVTIVEFANGDKVRITREKDDKDDIEKAIAIAMVKYAWGLKEYFNALENVVDSSKKSVIKKKPEKKETKEKTEKPLTKEQEQQKVIEITNQKEINIEYLKLYKNYEEYCEAQEKWLIRKDLWLTEKEFDLLKKYFK